MLPIVLWWPKKRLFPAVKASPSDSSLVVGNPVADFKLQHLTLAIRQIEFKGTIQNIRCLLIVVEHEMSAHRGNAVRET